MLFSISSQKTICQLLSYKLPLLSLCVQYIYIDLPRVTKSPKKLLKYSQYASRSQKRVDDAYITFYIRLYDQVREETIEHYSLLEMLSALGGAYGLVKLVTMIVFIPINKLIYEEHRIIMKQRNKRLRSHSTERTL